MVASAIVPAGCELLCSGIGCYRNLVRIILLQGRPVSRQSELEVTAKQGEDNGEQSDGRTRALTLRMVASKWPNF
jgi:hypothetical protein